jgi:hypothetical protein
LDVQEGSYLGHAEELGLQMREDAQSQLSKLRKCQVCALGGMFISYAKLYDKVTPSDCGGSQTTPLREYFETDQLRLIEGAFEGFDEFNIYSGCVDTFNFYYITTDSKTRLKLIMKNMLKNGGTFAPETQPKVFQPKES